MSLKTKQWFIDRIGKIVIRDAIKGDCKAYLESGASAVFIKDELQAQYLFDVQNDFFIDNNINLNYRDSGE